MAGASILTTITAWQRLGDGTEREPEVSSPSGQRWCREPLSPQAGQDEGAGGDRELLAQGRLLWVAKCRVCRGQSRGSESGGALLRSSLCSPPSTSHLLFWAAFWPEGCICSYCYFLCTQVIPEYIVAGKAGESLGTETPLLEHSLTVLCLCYAVATTGMASFSAGI